MSTHKNYVPSWEGKKSSLREHLMMENIYDVFVLLADKIQADADVDGDRGYIQLASYGSQAAIDCRVLAGGVKHRQKNEITDQTKQYITDIIDMDYASVSVFFKERAKKDPHNRRFLKYISQSFRKMWKISKAKTTVVSRGM